jgi:radical SAM protein with 4Fe4S-binding SPASM domain
MNKYGLGNLFEDWNGDFASFWKGSDTLYEFHMHAGQVDKACNPCEFYAQCRGGSKTRVIVQNREGNNSASINLSEMSGYDPLCPKDYLQRHEEVLIPSKRVSHFNRLRPIYMSHSL